MINITDGSDFSIRFDFIELGEFITPDINSVVYTVRDNEGVALASLTDVSVTTTNQTTEITIDIPASVNSISLEREFRFIVVKYKHQGNSKEIVKKYRILPWLNIGATPENVRSKLGITSSELADEEIDLYSAYFRIESELENSTLNDALTSGGILTDTANNLITVKAALQAFPSLQLRVSQVDKADTHEVRRLNKIDFTLLHTMLTQEYSELISALKTTSQTEVSIFRVVTPIDAITG